jgi:MSHA biogenesis protein MshQ
MIKFLLTFLLMVTSINSYAYWSCAWPYRTTLNVQENSASTLSDYQIKVTISGSNLNNAYNWTTNGFDLRILDSDDETLLDFWVESWNQVTETATVWIKLDTLTANQNRALYIYYGNEFADTLANVPFTFVEPGIKFHTRRVFSNPTDLTDAKNLFDTAGDDNAGYGCNFITDFTSINNASQFGQNEDFIAFSETYFNVDSSETGVWGIRYGSDFGGGGGLYVNGIPLEEQWSDDLWWDNNWNASNEVLQGTIELTAGYHKLEVIGQEGCCDGGITVQFQRPGDSFISYDVNDIDIRSRACPIANEPTVVFGAQATSSCPAPIAQYRMDQGPWSGADDVIDQTGNFPGTMVGSISNEFETQVCNGVNVNDNSSINVTSGLQTGVDIDSDVGPTGSVSFWIRTEEDWDANNVIRTYMDASLYINGSASDRYFYLEKLGNGRLQFRFEDSNDSDFTITEPSGTTRLQGVWYYLTVTWDFPNDQFSIYVGDSQVASGTPNTNGAISLLGNIHIGDNSSLYNIAPGDSSYASLDEVTIHNTVISVSEIRGLMAKTRTCNVANKACGNVFPDGLVALDDGNIEFGFDAKLLGNPNTQLSASNIMMNLAPNQFTCGDTDVCTTGDPVVPFVSAGPFQSRASTLDESVGFRGNRTVGDTANEFRNISTNSRATLTFSNSTYNEFYIDTLSIGNRNTVNLAPGTYWINNLSVNSRTDFNVLSGGPVRLYINNVTNLNSRLSMNSPSEGVAGTPEDFLIYIFDTDISFGTRTTITGTVYAEGDVTFASDGYIFGLFAAKNIDLASATKITYLESTYDGLSDLGWCESSLPSIGSIVVSSATTGINCLPTEVNVSIFDTNGDPLSAYEQPLNLSTNVNNGDWSVDNSVFGTMTNGVADDGIATYKMEADDAGDVTLFLSNTHAEVTQVTIEAEGISDTQTITFQSAGFAFSNIPTQISAQTSATLSIQAVETDQVTGACQALLLNNQTVEMAVECISPNSCGAASNQVNSTPVSTNGSGMVNSFSDVTLNFGDASSSTASFTNTYNDAGTLRLWARYQLLNSSGAATGNVIQGSSNVFVNRPAGFCIESPDANWQCSAPALNAGCSAFKQAGDNFNLLVTAKQANGASTDYCSHGTTNNFTNSVDLSHNLISPTAIDGGEAGNFSLTSINLTSGTGNSAANFSEMGVFTITAGGNTYFTETLPTNSSVNIGRFYPKEFRIVSTTSAIYNDGYSNLGGSAFTYTGQLEADGTGSISYDMEPTFTFEVRGFNDQKLNNFIMPLYSTPVSTISASSNTLDSNAAAMTVTAGFSAGVITGPDASDQFTYTFSSADHFVFDRTQASLIPPFTNDIQLSVDSLSVALDSIDLASAATISGLGGAIYYGRIRIENAYGPETSPVPQLFKAERFDGTQFVLNSLDNGTAYDLNGVNSIVVTDVGNLTNNLTATDSSIVGDLGATGQFASGLINTSWSVPANNRYGSYEFLYTVDNWLKYDWDNSADGINEDPTGSVNFGQFRGNDSIIYWKEIYY